MNNANVMNSVHCAQVFLEKFFTPIAIGAAPPAIVLLPLDDYQALYRTILIGHTQYVLTGRQATLPQ